MSDKLKILLVEDDPSLGYILKEYLEMNDFDVTWAKDGEEGFELFKKGNVNLCILDIMMPKKDGFSLAEDIKNSSPLTPIIFLTAKALKVDKLKGFKIGADDYIVKPIDEEELIARIQAIVKRTGAVPKAQSEDSQFQIGQYTFDYPSQTLLFNGEKRAITTKEAEILRLLCLNRGQILDRKETLQSVWGYSDYFSRRSMDVFISKLRKYLGDDETVKITNVHGKGYILE